MRTLVLGLVIAGASWLGGSAIATAMPITVATSFAGNDALMQPAPCRKLLPHRHSGAP